MKPFEPELISDEQQDEQYVEIELVDLEKAQLTISNNNNLPQPQNIQNIEEFITSHSLPV